MQLGRDVAGRKIGKRFTTSGSDRGGRHREATGTNDRNRQPTFFGRSGIPPRA